MNVRTWTKDGFTIKLMHDAPLGERTIERGQAEVWDGDTLLVTVDGLQPTHMFSWDSDYSVIRMIEHVTMGTIGVASEHFSAWATTGRILELGWIGYQLDEQFWSNLKQGESK